MITVLEKDGATIITIENPTGDEYNFISQAKKLAKERKGSSDANGSFWSKFKKNKKAEAPTTTNANAESFNNLEDFEEILGIDEIPF